MISKFLRLLAIAALSLCVSVGPVFSQAALLPNAKQTFVDQNGNPLSLGKIYSYVPNSTIFKSTWSDSGQTALNTNPVTLDAAGRAVIYGQGNYSQKVTDSLGNIQWTALTTAYGSSSPSGATGTDTAPVGTVMPFAGLVVPTNWQFAYGQAVSRTTFASLMTAITISDATVSCTSASPTLAGFASTAQFRLGMVIEASCVAPGTMITRILSATSVTVSANATATVVTTGVVFPWGNGDGATTFNVPDMRGRVMAGPDAMGGTAASRLQVTTTINTTSGSAAATVTSAAGIAAGMTVVSANVLASTTVSSITGTAVTLSANATATAGPTAATFQAFPSSDTPGATGGSATHVQTSAELAAHTHVATSVVTGGTTSYGGTGFGGVTAGGSFNTPINQVALSVATTNASTGGSAAATVVQPTIAINHIVKMAANTSGAGGVVSIGGMFGDILCGTNVTCASGTISFSGTPVLTQNQVYVGNASNQAVSVAMSGDCSIVASGAITCTKSSGSTIGTAAFQNIGTSGANVPLLSTANTWSLTQAFPAVTVTTLNGNTFTAGTGTLTLGAGKTLTTTTSGTLGGGDAWTLAVAAGKTLTSSTSGTLGGGDAWTLAIAAGKTLTASNTLTLTGTDASSVAFGTGGTVVYKIASGSSAMNTAAIASTACNTTTVAATGTLTTDVVAASFNGSTAAVTGYAPLTAGGLSIRPYPTADNVNFEICNGTVSSITPGALTLNWRVTR